MYVPGISERLGKRKGGGGKGGGGGGGGRGGGGGGGSSSGSKGSSGGSTPPPPYSKGAPPPPYSVSGGSTTRGSSMSNGGGKPYTVSNGPFKGRSAGGATRAQIYGSRAYGSGYPGAGVGGGRGFPFVFWPLYFPGHPFFYGSHIYGPADNNSRPGGALATYTLLPSWAYPSPPTNGTQGPPGNTFALYGDSNSANDLVTALEGANCSIAVHTKGADFNSGPSSGPDPQQVVQYYRASSFALLLQGYNNTFPDLETNSSTAAAAAPSANDTFALLPSTVNMTYFNCLNASIGNSLSLIDVNNAAAAVGPTSSLLLTLPALVVAWALAA